MKDKPKQKKFNCESCEDKGFYTQMVDNGMKPHKIACSDCNYRNKKGMKGIYKSVFESMGYN